MSDKTAAELREAMFVYATFVPDNWHENDVKQHKAYMANDLDALLAATRREALESARDTQCLLCRKGLPLKRSPANGVMGHGGKETYESMGARWMPCNSCYIHELLAESQDDKGETK